MLWLVRFPTKGATELCWQDLRQGVAVLAGLSSRMSKAVVGWMEDRRVSIKEHDLVIIFITCEEP